MTLDFRAIYPNDSGKYRTKGDNLEKQTCFFNVRNNGKLVNVFPSKIIRNSEASTDKTYFQIKRVRSRIRNTDEMFDDNSE